MRICLIGPTYPFRGGISHYTTLLFRHLKKQHNAYFFAFKRQYPKWLYPGKGDKDVSGKPIYENEVDFVLDSLNPITWISVFIKIRKINPELVIFPWWVSFWAPQFYTIITLVKRFTSAKILFICHNVVEHESKTIDKFLTGVVLKMGNFFIVHSDDDLNNLKEIVSNANIKKSFHPTYKVFDTGTIDKNEAKKKLKIEGHTILFFGFVRPYKGLTYLLDAIPLVIEQMDINLLIVGEFWNGKDDYLKQIKHLNIQKWVKVINKYVPNEEVEIYFAASDVVVLPYISATGSGIVQTAFGCNRPVISTNVGSLPEVITHGKTGYIVPPRDSKAIAEAIISFYKKETEREFAINILREKKKFSWSRLIETIESFHINPAIK
jgi:glycosyltransferase involved in cell wall biosynthesis